jgi:hypothetical protein
MVSDHGHLLVSVEEGLKDRVKVIPRGAVVLYRDNDIYHI